MKKGLLEIRAITRPGLRSPPFGGSLLAEVNGAWLDGESGRHRVSIRLLDPLS